MSKKYKEADVRNAIKQGLKNYADLARVLMKRCWKNMNLQQRCDAARSLVFMENVAKNPDAYFSRETTEKSWHERAEEYGRKNRMADFSEGYEKVENPTQIVMKRANAALVAGSGKEYERFCMAVQCWMYDGHSDTFSKFILDATKNLEEDLEYESAKCLIRPFIGFTQSFCR